VPHSAGCLGSRLAGVLATAGGPFRVGARLPFARQPAYPLDLAVSHLNEPVTVLHNEADTAGRHWLGVELQGANHRDVVGARIILEAGGRRQTRFAKGGGSYLSSWDRRHVFGLGSADRVGRLRVVWPAGKEQEWQGPDTDGYWRLTEGKLVAVRLYQGGKRAACRLTKRSRSVPSLCSSAAGARNREGRLIEGEGSVADSPQRRDRRRAPTPARARQ